MAVEDQILQYFKIRPDQIYKSQELAKRLRVSNRDYQAFKRTVRRLAEEGRILRYKGNKYGMLRKPIEVTGILHVKTQGYGFLIRDDGGEDVFVGQRNMGSAVHGDRVRVTIWVQSAGRLPEGKVVEIIERGRDRIVGIFQEARTFNYVVPDDLKIGRDIRVRETDRGKARAGQKVVVKIIKWGDSRRMPEGRVVEVLGRPEDEGVDVLSVIRGFDLPTEFPKAVLDEIQILQSEIPVSEVERRLDLRDGLVFTIDPEDAMDFDDAVSLEHLDNGNFRLGVHIADVSHFVPVGSPLDREALRRGTSVYLVDRVIPMLPERLSSDICSLRPNEDRLAFSVLMELNPDGTVVDYEFRETIIRSKHRLTYKDAQRLMEDSRTDVSDLDKDGALRICLREMAGLSRILIERWRRAGMIDFDVPEPEVVLDEKGRPIRLGVRERLESHRLIEAFMLLANRTVAEHIQRLHRETGRKVPFVYRIHERPGGKKLDEFVRFVKALGYRFDVDRRASPKKFQSLLRIVAGTRHEIIVEEITLRTMMKALYSTRNVGHFGLAFPAYTHFTSPIRRYPDLIVHRLLKAYDKEEAEIPRLAAKLSDICEISTEREIAAQEAERESIRAKQVEYMEAQIGEVFDGVISGVTSFGIFVEIPEYLVEGLVHISELDDDYYVYDEKGFSLMGQNKGTVYRLGDAVRVKLVRVLKEMRKLDFEMAE